MLLIVCPNLAMDRIWKCLISGLLSFNAASRRRLNQEEGQQCRPRLSRIGRRSCIDGICRPGLFGSNRRVSQQK